MSGTLVDEDRPPPTLRDPLEPTQPEAPSPRRPNRPRAAVVITIVGAVAATIALAGLAGYFLFFRYEPVARRHVPGNANLVARASVADLVLFGPVREHLLPLLASHESSGKSRGDRIREATGVSLSDLREIVVASVDTSSWVVIAGGRIDRGRFVDGLAEVAREEGWPGWKRSGDLLLGPGGVAIGQAEDGTILVGTSASIVGAALPASDEPRRVELPEDGAVTFAVGKQAWSGAAISARIARATALGKVERASGRLTLGDAPALSVSIQPAAGVEAAALAQDIEELLGEARLVMLLLPDVAGEKGALQSARAISNADRVTVTASWPYEGLDRAARRFAELIRALGGTP